MYGPVQYVLACALPLAAYVLLFFSINYLLPSRVFLRGYMAVREACNRVVNMKCLYYAGRFKG